MRCSYCDKALCFSGAPAPSRAWCDEDCQAAWDAAHPKEAAGWIRVEDATPEQRAELDALLRPVC